MRNGAGRRFRPTSFRFTASPRVTRGFKRSPGSAGKRQWTGFTHPSAGPEGRRRPVTGTRPRNAPPPPQGRQARSPGRLSPTPARPPGPGAPPRLPSSSPRLPSSSPRLSSSSPRRPSFPPFRFAPLGSAQAEISQLFLLIFLLSVQHAQFLSSFQPSGRYTPGPSYS